MRSHGLNRVRIMLLIDIAAPFTPTPFTSTFGGAGVGDGVVVGKCESSLIKILAETDYPSEFHSKIGERERINTSQAVVIGF